MTDLEMTKLCAEAMGYRVIEDAKPSRKQGAVVSASAIGAPDSWEYEYDPLHNDEQAMALVKRFRLDVFGSEGTVWGVSHGVSETVSDDLNRAIVECIAKMQGLTR